MRSPGFSGFIRSNVVGLVAIFIALGGTAGALSGKNKVDSGDIKRGNVKSSDLARNAVKSPKVARDTLNGTDILESSLVLPPPSGPAGGDLAGNYPDPSLRDGVVTPAKFGTIPAVRAFHSTTQSIPANTLTDVALDSEAFDTASMHDTGANNSRLTAPVSGLYSITAAAAWFVNPTGFRTAQIWRNDQTILLSDDVHPDQDTDHVLATLAPLSAGDYVELRVSQTSGGPLNLATGPQGETPVLAMHWVAPG